MIDGDYSIDAVKPEDIYREARDRLVLAQTAESDNRKKAKEDLIFFEGIGHWDGVAATTQGMESPKVTINLTEMFVTRTVNNMKQQKPRGKAHAVADAKVEEAETINGLGRHIEARSEASVAYDTGGEFAAKSGWGYARLIPEWAAADSFDREIRIAPIMNVFTVYLDPGAEMPTACDMTWALITVKQKKAEFKRQNPRADMTDFKDAAEDSDWEDREEIRLAEYFRIRSVPDKLLELKGPDGSTRNVFERDFRMDDPQYQGMTITRNRDSARKQVEWFLLNGKKVIQREVLPGEYIPIVRFEGNAVNIDGQIMRRGMVRNMRDPQKMVDFAEAAKIQRLGLTPKAPWVGAEGQFDGHPEWDDANTVAYSKLTYKPVMVDNGQGGMIPLPPPQRLQPAGIEAGFTEMAQQMRANLAAVAGQPNEPGQDAQGQVISGQAIKRRQGLSDQSHFQYYDKQTLAIAQIWRIMLQWIPVYYSEARMQRIIGEDGMPSMVPINQQYVEDGIEKIKHDMTVGRYDVVMDTGPGYDTKREENADNMIALLTNKAIAEIVVKVAPDLIFRGMDYPYAQDIADRLAAQTPDGLKKMMNGMSSQAKSIIQSLSAQNQQLQQALQQAQEEAKFGMAKAHLQAVTKAHDTEESNKTKRHDIEVSNETKRFDTEARSHTALAVEEIKAGASLLNTHVEAEHNKAAAELLLETSEKAETQ